jgi:SOS response regulatory protein OraA/RecX
VLDRLAGAGYLDDERVVRDRAVRLADRGYGDAAIRLDLERRGAAPELTEQTIAALEPERSRAERLVEKHGGGVRTARTLARKGFSEASVERALAAVAQDARGGLG